MTLNTVINNRMHQRTSNSSIALLILGNINRLRKERRVEKEAILKLKTKLEKHAQS